MACSSPEDAGAVGVELVEQLGYVRCGLSVPVALEAIAGHELYPLYFLAATTGMRRGEVAGLRWRNVDLEAARLTVNQQIVSVEYELIEDDLKTASSRRTIDLDEQTIAIL